MLSSYARNLIQEVGILFSCRARDSDKSVQKSKNGLIVWLQGTQFQVKMAAGPECTHISSLGKGDSLHQQGGNTGLRY